MISHGSAYARVRRGPQTGNRVASAGDGDPDEIGGVATFAALGQAERERLSRAAADMMLVPGEYAAPEGSERALFAVLEGRVEAVKLVDGIERVVGTRQPGDVFGEVPIALGAVFPVGFRAAERSRIMRLEASDYHAVASVVPDVATGNKFGEIFLSGSAHASDAIRSRPRVMRIRVRQV